MANRIVQPNNYCLAVTRDCIALQLHAASALPPPPTNVRQPVLRVFAFVYDDLLMTKRPSFARERTRNEVRNNSGSLPISERSSRTSPPAGIYRLSLYTPSRFSPSRDSFSPVILDVARKFQLAFPPAPPPHSPLHPHHVKSIYRPTRLRGCSLHPEATFYF